MDVPGDLPAPARRERHPAGFDVRARFPRLRLLLGMEGGAVYVADDREGHHVVTDEGLLAWLLDDPPDCVSVLTFRTAAERDDYCARRWPGAHRG